MGPENPDWGFQRPNWLSEGLEGLIWHLRGLIWAQSGLIWALGSQIWGQTGLIKVKGLIKALREGGKKQTGNRKPKTQNRDRRKLFCMESKVIGPNGAAIQKAMGHQKRTRSSKQLHVELISK